MTRRDPVEAYIEKHPRWSDGLRDVRAVLQRLPLEETIKWGAPCYVHAGRNVVSLVGFQDWFALWFHEGGRLDDPAGVLVKADGSKSEAMLHLRFKARREVKKRLVRNYVERAIEQAAAPRAKQPRRTRAIAIPPELMSALRADRAAARAFEGLTPGRQRDYAEYVAEAKRADTKARRLEKILPMIRAGQGLNDRYRC